MLCSNAFSRSRCCLGFDVTWLLGQNSSNFQFNRTLLVESRKWRLLWKNSRETDATLHKCMVVVIKWKIENKVYTSLISMSPFELVLTKSKMLLIT